MKFMLSKEHYCYQIPILHTNEKQCLPPFITDKPLILQENLEPAPYK